MSSVIELNNVNNICTCNSDISNQNDCLKCGSTICTTANAEGLYLGIGADVFFVSKDGIIRPCFVVSIHNDEGKVTVRLSEKPWSQSATYDEKRHVSDIFVDVNNLKIPKRDKSSKAASAISLMKKPQSKPRAVKLLVSKVSEPVIDKKLDENIVKVVTPEKNVLSDDIDNIENDTLPASELNEKIMKKLERDYTVVKDNSGIYAGALNKRGKREGKGLLTYAKTSENEMRNQWYGYFERNQINGKGILTYIDGKVFKGIAKNGNIKYGTMRYPKEDKFGRTIYKGCFGSDGKQGGTGKLEYSNGMSYDGQWKNGRPNGNGIAYYPDTSVFKGSFSMGLYHGYGRLKTEFGDILEGVWEKGKLVGNGRIAFSANSDRKIYEGEFLNSEMHKGTLTYRDGRVYEGEFEHNVPNGKGSIKLSNQASAVLEGQWQNGSMISLSLEK